MSFSSGRTTAASPGNVRSGFPASILQANCRFPGLTLQAVVVLSEVNSTPVSLGAACPHSTFGMPRIYCRTAQYVIQLCQEAMYIYIIIYRVTMQVRIHSLFVKSLDSASSLPLEPRFWLWHQEQEARRNLERLVLRSRFRQSARNSS